MVGMDRLELSTSRLSVARSGPLSYTPICKLYRVLPPRTDRSRTHQLWRYALHLLWGRPAPYLITTVLLRNSDKHLIDWLDLSEEHIGGTLGSTSAPTATCRSPIATTAGRGYIFSLCKMVRMERLELSALRLKVECSTTELHPHIYFYIFLNFLYILYHNFYKKSIKYVWSGMRDSNPYHQFGRLGC